MNDTIFVQIASYRDPELLPTINNCINKAKNPDRLTFGICWQRSKEDLWDQLDDYKEDPRFKILEVDYKDSKGLCWARSLIQKMYSGEDYTLQIDSHHRFLQDWDEHLIGMMNLVDSEKPIITSYAGQYSPYSGALLNEEPYKMVADKFTESGTIMFYPTPIPDWEKLKAPIPARFVSGHFFFTLGKHCIEYKYDPNLYFAGDEISLSIRSYTLGYDLYHPHYTVIWHEYTREGRTKHWTDFSDDNKAAGIVDKAWHEMDVISKRRLRHMLREEDNGIDLGEYGLGNVRTHHDYELYAGINFSNRKLHDDTLKGINPPINDNSEWFKVEEIQYDYELKIPPVSDFKFIYIGVEDEFGNVLYRQDLTEWKKYVRVSIKSKNKPHMWVFWPMDKAGNWFGRQDFKLP